MSNLLRLLDDKYLPAVTTMGSFHSFFLSSSLSFFLATKEISKSISFFLEPEIGHNNFYD